MQELEIIIPTKFSTNQIHNKHWRWREARQKEFHKATYEAVKKYKTKKITDYPINVTYVYYIKGKQLDILNLASMSKMIEDSLRYVGILVDDSPKYVEQVVLLENKSKRQYSYCVVELD